MTTKYQEIYKRSIQDAAGFWSDVAKDIFWYKKPTKILNSENPPFYKWFQDGTTNTCYNAVDYHVKNGKGFIEMLGRLSPDIETPHWLVDLGSGGGVPAFVIAEQFPHWQLFLVERKEKRAEKKSLPFKGAKKKRFAKNASKNAAENAEFIEAGGGSRPAY